MTDNVNRTILNLSMRDVLNMEQNLVVIGQLKNMPFKTSWRIARMLNQIKPELAVFNTKREDLIRLYGSPVESDPNQYQLDMENQDVFQNAIDSILGDIVLQGINWDPLTKDSFGAAADSITALQLASIYTLVEPVIPDNAVTLTLTLKQVLDMEAALGAVARLENVPSDTAFRLAGLIVNFQSVIEGINKRRADMIRSIGTIDATDPTKFNIPEEKVEDFKIKMDEMLAEATTVNNWAPLELDAFGEKAEANITAVQIAALMPLFSIPVED